MADRKPVAANRFYPGDPDMLEREVTSWLAQNSNETKTPVWGVMLPHAGYIYCGDVIAKTLGRVQLKPRLIILCPNHTGYGTPLGVWPKGEWLTPLGSVPVDAGLASQIIVSSGGFQADLHSHLGEHSIEVALPFLQITVPDLTIVPIAVGTQNPDILAIAGKALAEILKQPANSNVGIVISSDMNHYENESATITKDNMALEQIMAADPKKLLETTSRNQISMCGAGPMALALFAAKALGQLTVEVVSHHTSAVASGDSEHTVGYAGVLLNLKAA